jgi:hypothetical protein
MRKEKFIEADVLPLPPVTSTIDFQIPPPSILYFGQLSLLFLSKLIGEFNARPRDLRVPNT